MSPDRGVPSSILLVLTAPDGPASAAEQQVVSALRALAPQLQVAAGKEVAGLTVDHVLRAARTDSAWRRPLLSLADRVPSAAARAGYAARFDPWFRATVREVETVVVLGPGGEAVADVAKEFGAAAPVVGQEEATALCRRLAIAAMPTPGAGRRTRLADHDLARLLAAVSLVGGEAGMPERLRALPGLTQDPEQLVRLTQAAAQVLGEDEATLRAWSVLAGGDAIADTDAPRLAAALLGEADDLLPTDPPAAARRAVLALRVLLPGEETTGRRLLADPTAYLGGVRATDTWMRLSGSAERTGRRRTAPAAGPSAHRQVVLLPGIGSSSLAGLRAALRVSPAVGITLVARGDLPGGLRRDGVPPALIGMLLGTVEGWGDYADLVTTALDPAPDVAVVDGVGPGAVLASLVLPESTRMVLTLRPRDVTRPWVHLLDWRRVDVVLTEDDDTLTQVRSVLDPSAGLEQAEVRAVPGLDDLLGGEGNDDEAAVGAVREAVLGPVGRLAHLSEHGRHEEAVELARAALVPEAAVDPALLQQAALVASRAGEPTLRLELLRRWATLDPRPHLQELVRQQEGRLREFLPGWLPGDLPTTPVDPVPGRVLHLLKVSLPHRTSGYAVRSSYLLRERARAGHDVLAVTALDFPEPTGEVGVGRPAPGSPASPAEVDVVGEVPHLRLLRPDIPERETAEEHLAAFAEALLAVVVEHRPAVIHAHSGHRGYELALVALAVGRATGVRVVYEVRGFFEAVWTSDVARATTAEVYRLRSAAEARCLTMADAVVTLSQSMREDILARTDDADGRVLDPARVVVVPNGVDDQAIHPIPRDEALAASLGATGDLVVGYVSNLDHPREGQEVLVEAVALLRERGLAVTAVLVGGGERREELTRLAHARGVGDHVVLTGVVPHERVADYYALLDVFVVPRIDERAARLVTPLKPYEAMAMGLPLVVSALPALLEIIGDTEPARGVSFPPGDAAALADVLAELAGEPGRERREALATAGREWVRAHRTWAALAARYDEVYAAATAP